MRRSGASVSHLHKLIIHTDSSYGFHGSGARKLWGTDLRPSIIHSSHWNLAACEIIHRYCNLPYLHLWFSVKEGWAAGSISKLNWKPPQFAEFCQSILFAMRSLLFWSTRLVTFHTWTTPNGSKHRTSQTCPTLRIRHRRMTCTRMLWRKPSTLSFQPENQSTANSKLLQPATCHLPTILFFFHKVIFRIEFHAQKCLLV